MSKTIPAFKQYARELICDLDSILERLEKNFKQFKKNLEPLKHQE
ncbi:MAG: hypothetical protein R6U96_16035 [Promethearchaeia archaeon]